MARVVRVVTVTTVAARLVFIGRHCLSCVGMPVFIVRRFLVGRVAGVGTVTSRLMSVFVGLRFAVSFVTRVRTVPDRTGCVLIHREIRFLVLPFQGGCQPVICRTSLTKTEEGPIGYT